MIPLSTWARAHGISPSYARSLAAGARLPRAVQPDGPGGLWLIPVTEELPEQLKRGPKARKEGKE